MQVEVRSFLLRGGRGVIRLLRKNDGVVKDGFRLFDEGVGLWVYFPPPPPPLVLFAFSFLLSSVDFAFTEAFPLGFSVFPCFCFGLVSFLEQWKNCCIHIFGLFQHSGMGRCFVSSNRKDHQENTISLFFDANSFHS
jgi:hypothetical protein